MDRNRVPVPGSQALRTRVQSPGNVGKVQVGTSTPFHPLPLAVL